MLSGVFCSAVTGSARGSSVRPETDRCVSCGAMRSDSSLQWSNLLLPVIGLGHHVGDVAAQYDDVGAELFGRVMAGGYLSFVEGDALLFPDVPLRPVELAGVVVGMVHQVLAEKADFLRCRVKSLLRVDKARP